MTLTVERPADGQARRDGRADRHARRLAAWVEPVDPSAGSMPLDVPGLGLAMAVEPKVAGGRARARPPRRPGSSRATSLRSMTLTPAKVGKKSTPKPVTIQLDGKVAGWPLAFAVAPGSPLDVGRADDRQGRTSRSRSRPRSTRTGSTRSGGCLRAPDPARLPAARPGRLAPAGGRGDAARTSSSVFRIFQSLCQGRVGGDALGGVIPIAQIAYSTGQLGLDAVHPLPGDPEHQPGRAQLPADPAARRRPVRLPAAEKVRGKPLPDVAPERRDDRRRGLRPLPDRLSSTARTSSSWSRAISDRSSTGRARGERSARRGPVAASEIPIGDQGPGP